MNIKDQWNRLSLRWKWTFSSAVMTVFVFSTFSVILIFAMSQWMFQEEKDTVTSVTNDIVQFYESTATFSRVQEVYESRGLIEQIYERGQTIRLFNEDGYELFIVESAATFGLQTPFQPVDELTITRQSVNGNEVYVSRSPIRSPQFSGYVEIVHPLSDAVAMRNYMILLSIVLAIGALVLSSVIAYFLAGKFIEPVVSLGQAMRTIQKEGFQDRLQTPEVQDEVGGLVVIFNDMMTELEQSFQKQRQFVEDASHELRTPIQIVEGHLALINRWGKRDPEVMEESLSISIQELNRIKLLVNELLTLSRVDREVADDEEPTMDPVAEMQLLAERFHEMHPETTFTVRSHAQSKPVRMAPRHVTQIMTILLDNAVKYANDQQVIIELNENRRNELVVEVIDKGIGIPERDLPHIFDRFYRVDKARSRAEGGNGLGLSIAKRLVELYGGSIDAISREGKGTTIRFTLVFHKTSAT